MKKGDLSFLSTHKLFYQKPSFQLSVFNVQRSALTAIIMLTTELLLVNDLPPKFD